MDIFPDLFKLAWRKNRSVREELQHQSWTRGLENGERGRNGKLHQTLGFGAECSADKRTRCNQMEVDSTWRVLAKRAYNTTFSLQVLTASLLGHLSGKPKQKGSIGSLLG